MMNSKIDWKKIREEEFPVLKTMTFLAVSYTHLSSDRNADAGQSVSGERRDGPAE